MTKNYLLVFILLLSFVSCRKEGQLDKGKPGSAKNLSLVTPSGVSMYDDMLYFPDMATLDATIDALNQEIITYDNDFVSANQGLTIEELNDLQDLINYNCYQPFADFEAQYPGYASLRKKIADDVAVWLDTDGGNYATNPDNHFITSQDIRTVLNEQGQVRVGNTIYMAYDGGYIEVYNADLGVLADIETGAIDVNAEPTQTTLGIFQNLKLAAPNCDDARNGMRMSDVKQSGDKRTEWKLVAENVLWWHRVKGKVDGFKKKNNGKWKAYRSDLWVKVEGIVYERENCTAHSFDMASNGWRYSGPNPGPITDSKEHVKAVAPFGGAICIKKGDVRGTFLGAGGIVHYQSLTW